MTKLKHLGLLYLCVAIFYTIIGAILFYCQEPYQAKASRQEDCSRCFKTQDGKTICEPCE